MVFKTAKLSVEFEFTQVGGNDFGGPTFSPLFRKQLSFSAGTGNKQADQAFIDHRTIAGSANDDIDLAGVLVDVFGATITSAEIVGLIIASKDTNANVLSVGGGTNPVAGLWGASGDIIKISPGGIMLVFGPSAIGASAIVAGTGDILRVTNGGAGNVEYDIAFLGRSA